MVVPVGTQTHHQAQPRRTNGPSLVAKSPNFCQLLSRQAAGPVERRGWGLWAAGTKHSLASPFQAGSTRPCPRPHEDREILVPRPGTPNPAPPGPPCPPPLHPPPRAGGARPGSRGQRRRRLAQISDLA